MPGLNALTFISKLKYTGFLTVTGYILVFIPLCFLGCKTEKKVSHAAFGTADFSRTISIGNSLTAGESNDGLYRSAQLNSYPAIMGGQIQSIGGGVFYEPLFTVDQAVGSGYIELVNYNAYGIPQTTYTNAHAAFRGDVYVPGYGAVLLYDKYTGPINNYGVPGIKLRDILDPNYGNTNGLYERLLYGDAPNNTTTYIDFINEQPFTFFSNWLGNNDLEDAASGWVNSLPTDTDIYAAIYTQLTSRLIANGQKGVVATIPDVGTVPYYHTLSIAALLAGAKQKDPSINAIYINARVSTDITNKTYTTRMATDSDRVTSSFDPDSLGSFINGLPYGLTPAEPIENGYILDAKEYEIEKMYVKAYNDAIKSIANKYNLALFDAHDFLENINANGLIVNGKAYNTSYQGGLFSLDGIHLAPTGYAILANEFIEVINQKYGSSIPPADVSKY